MEEKALQEAKECAATTIRLIEEMLAQRKLEWRKLREARVKASHAENVLLNLDLRLRGHRTESLDHE